LTGLSNVNKYVDKGENARARTPGWAISFDACVEVEADGRS
jgi:hypothetical protein